MSEEPDEPPDQADEIDFTLIRQLLAMSPAERLTHIVESSNNLMDMLEKRRIV